MTETIHIVYDVLANHTEEYLSVRELRFLIFNEKAASMTKRTVAFYIEKLKRLGKQIDEKELRTKTNNIPYKVYKLTKKSE